MTSNNNGNGNNGNGNSNSGNGNSSGSSIGNGNATNAETNNSQNQSGILFPIASETSDTESYLIGLIKTSGKEKNYELIEYINDVNREYAETLVEQNINGALDTAYVYGAAIGTGSDRLSLDRFDGSTGYYLYAPRGSMTGLTNEEGQIYQSYRYSVFGEITFGAPQYENEYTYNGESYNPNIKSLYLRARYYCVVTADFLTEDSYLGRTTEPLTLNRYNYCLGNPMNYADPSGNIPFFNGIKDFFSDIWDAIVWLFTFDQSELPEIRSYPIPTPSPAPTEVPAPTDAERESSIPGDNYLESGTITAESKLNTEECILLDIAGCQVESYDMSYVVDFIKKFENFSATLYYATADEKERGILTIGYGHVIREDEKTIYTIQYIMSEEEASSVLKEDIKGHFPTDIMEKVLEVHGPITQNQLDALVALRYNNPTFTIKKSPNFTRILINEDYSEEDVKQMIVNEFLTYKLQGDKVLPGLVKRGTAEAILFLENDYFIDYDDLYSDPDVLDKYINFLIKYDREDMIEYLK